MVSYDYKMQQVLLQYATVILLQNATEVYYKMRHVFYYKMRRLLQIARVQCEICYKDICSPFLHNYPYTIGAILHSLIN